MSIISTLNLEIDQYATNNIQLLWLDNSTGLPKDLTDYSALMQIKNQIGDTRSLLVLSTANGKITLGDETGEVNITFQPIDTNFTIPGSLPWDTAFYDIYLTNTMDNTVTCLSRGMITLILGVSL